MSETILFNISPPLVGGGLSASVDRCRSILAIFFNLPVISPPPNLPIKGEGVLIIFQGRSEYNKQEHI
jgi:hypothetical protein